ncbi:hypothetical protein N752_25060 [Desulforamulus aquiferis]|nr:tautomerase family protein [Desulforamulus aquiferis]RYD02601.1 hypothetical protein N752_25060 [Desulforamulus aquiferis]
MPIVKIEIISGKSTDYKKAVMAGVHSALVEAFSIPEYDNIQRLYELDKLCFEIPPTKTEDFTLIEISAFPGRSLEAKKKLYSCIVNNLASNPGIKGDDIFIVINEPSLESWGIRGGKPASEINFGFKIDV